ncbi:MAG: hypothetical protein ACK5PP_10335 [Acidimicrobiales bacterium]
MTGGTSGLGAIAVDRLLAEPGTRLLVGARGSASPAADRAETLPVDLASLGSVRRFAAAVGERLGPATIDALILNAG